MDCLQALHVRRIALLALLAFTLTACLDSDDSTVVELGDHTPATGLRRIRLGSSHAEPAPADDSKDFEAAVEAEKAREQSAEQSQEEDKAAADALTVAAETELSAQQREVQARAEAQKAQADADDAADAVYSQETAIDRMQGHVDSKLKQVQLQATNTSALSVENAKDKAHEASDELQQAVSAAAQMENTKASANAQKASLTTAAGEAEAEVRRIKQQAEAAVKDAQATMEQSVEQARQESQRGIDDAEKVRSISSQASGDAQAALENALVDQEVSQKAADERESFAAAAEKRLEEADSGMSQFEKTALEEEATAARERVTEAQDKLEQAKQTVAARQEAAEKVRIDLDAAVRAKAEATEHQSQQVSGAQSAGEETVASVKGAVAAKLSSAKQTEADAINQMKSAQAAASEADKMLKTQEQNVLDAKQDVQQTMAHVQLETKAGPGAVEKAVDGVLSAQSGQLVEAQKQLQYLRDEKVKLDKKAASAAKAAQLYADSGENAKGDLAKATSVRQLQAVRLQEARGIKVPIQMITASSTVADANFSPDKAIDGDSQTYFTTAARPEEPATIEMVFGGGAYHVHTVSVQWKDTPGEFRVELSNDQLSWRFVAVEDAGEPGQMYNTTISPTDRLKAAQFMRILMRDPVGPHKQYISAYEISVTGIRTKHVLEAVARPLLTTARITSSSSFGPAYAPELGVLGVQTGGGWRPATSDTSEWLQVDLFRAMSISRVSTQGGSEAEFCERYNLSTSLDGVHWNPVGTFGGNTDGGPRGSLTSHDFEYPQYGRFVRFSPFQGSVPSAMRVQLHGNSPGITAGVLAGFDSPLIGSLVSNTGSSPDGVKTAAECASKCVDAGESCRSFSFAEATPTCLLSRERHSAGIALAAEVEFRYYERARPLLHTVKVSSSSAAGADSVAEMGVLGAESGRGWQPAVDGAMGSNYLQVDLGHTMEVIRLLIQGVNKTAYCSQFNLTYSVDGGEWQLGGVYSGNNGADPLKAESIMLRQPAIGKIFRIFPIESVPIPAMRVELLGFEAGLVRGKKSCQDLYEDGTHQDGLQLINPSGGEQLMVYCDMTRDGGGWTLLVTSASNNGWTADTLLSRNENAASAANDYSILRAANAMVGASEDVEPGSRFEYRLEANTPGAWGGIFSAPTESDMVANTPHQKSSMLHKFGEWQPGEESIQLQLPWVDLTDRARLTTSTTGGASSWGTIAEERSQFNPAPWINSAAEASPGVIWYWIRQPGILAKFTAAARGRLPGSDIGAEHSGVSSAAACARLCLQQEDVCKSIDFSQSLHTCALNSAVLGDEGSTPNDMDINYEYFEVRDNKGRIMSSDRIYLSSATSHLRLAPYDGQIVAQIAKPGWDQAISITKVDDQRRTAIQSGDRVYLKIAATDKFIDVQGIQVRETWTDTEKHAAQQTFVIEKGTPGALHTGEKIWLKAYSGKNIDTDGKQVQARWEGRGTIQALRATLASNLTDQPLQLALQEQHTEHTDHSRVLGLPPFNVQVSLQSSLQTRIICTEKDVSQTSSTEHAPSSHELFTLVDGGDGTVGLQTWRGSFIAADADGETVTQTQPSKLMLAEWSGAKFTPIQSPGGSWLFQTAHGSYLRANEDRATVDQSQGANSEDRAALADMKWEHFLVVQFSDSGRLNDFKPPERAVHAEDLIVEPIAHVATSSVCAALCIQEKSCHSFSYTGTEHQCLLSSTVLDGTGEVQKASSSPFEYFERLDIQGNDRLHKVSATAGKLTLPMQVSNDGKSVLTPSEAAQDGNGAAEYSIIARNKSQVQLVLTLLMDPTIPASFTIQMDNQQVGGPLHPTNSLWRRFVVPTTLSMSVGKHTLRIETQGAGLAFRSMEIRVEEGDATFAEPGGFLQAIRSLEQTVIFDGELAGEEFSLKVLRGNPQRVGKEEYFSVSDSIKSEMSELLPYEKSIDEEATAVLRTEHGITLAQCAASCTSVGDTCQVFEYQAADSSCILGAETMPVAPSSAVLLSLDEQTKQLDAKHAECAATVTSQSGVWVQRQQPVGGFSAPPDPPLLISGSALLPPMGYEQLWKSCPLETGHSLHWWHPKPPHGYKCLGSLGTIGDASPPFDAIQCVPDECASAVPTANLPAATWSSSIAADPFSVWATTFGVHGTANLPTAVYALNGNCLVGACSVTRLCCPSEAESCATPSTKEYTLPLEVARTQDECSAQAAAVYKQCESSLPVRATFLALDSSETFPAGESLCSAGVSAAFSRQMSGSDIAYIVSQGKWVGINLQNDKVVEGPHPIVSTSSPFKKVPAPFSSRLEGAVNADGSGDSVYLFSGSQWVLWDQATETVVDGPAELSQGPFEGLPSSFSQVDAGFVDTSKRRVELVLFFQGSWVRYSVEQKRALQGPYLLAEHTFNKLPPAFQGYINGAVNRKGDSSTVYLFCDTNWVAWNLDHHHVSDGPEPIEAAPTLHPTFANVIEPLHLCTVPHVVESCFSVSPMRPDERTQAKAEHVLSKTVTKMLASDATLKVRKVDVFAIEEESPVAAKVCLDVHTSSARAAHRAAASLSMQQQGLASAVIQQAMKYGYAPLSLVNTTSLLSSHVDTWARVTLSRSSLLLEASASGINVGFPNDIPQNAVDPMATGMAWRSPELIEDTGWFAVAIEYPAKVKQIVLSWQGTAESDSDGCTLSANAVPFAYTVARSMDGVAFTEAGKYGASKQQCASDGGTGHREDVIAGWKETTMVIRFRFSAADSCRVGCTLGNYVLLDSVAVFGSACGDGKRAPSEACDDGNTVSGDGCSQTCRIEVGWKCSGGNERRKDACLLDTKIVGQLQGLDGSLLTVQRLDALQDSPLVLEPLMLVGKAQNQKWLIEGGRIISTVDPRFAVTADFSTNEVKLRRITAAENEAGSQLWQMDDTQVSLVKDPSIMLTAEPHKKQLHAFAKPAVWYTTGGQAQSHGRARCLAEQTEKPQCANGIRKGRLCCASSCGTCGGSGCGSRPGGAKKCCGGKIEKSRVTCRDGRPPCIIAALYNRKKSKWWVGTLVDAQSKCTESTKCTELLRRPGNNKWSVCYSVTFSSRGKSEAMIKRSDAAAQSWLLVPPGTVPLQVTRTLGADTTCILDNAQGTLTVAVGGVLNQDQAAVTEQVAWYWPTPPEVTLSWLGLPQYTKYNISYSVSASPESLLESSWAGRDTEDVKFSTVKAADCCHPATGRCNTTVPLDARVGVRWWVVQGGTMGEVAPFRGALAEQPGFSVPDVCPPSGCAVVPLAVCNPLGLTPAWQDAMGPEAVATCYHRGQWFYRGQPTCVGYGEPGDACDDFQFVCGTESLVGSVAEQAEWVREAAQSSDFLSPLCPSPGIGRGACLLSVSDFSGTDSALTFEPTLKQLSGTAEVGVSGGVLLGAADNSSAAVDRVMSISWQDQTSGHGYAVLPAGRRSNKVQLQPTSVDRPGGKWRVSLDAGGRAAFSVDDVVWAAEFEPTIEGPVIAFWASRGSALVVRGLRVRDLTGAGVQGLSVTNEQGCGEKWCSATNTLDDTGDDLRGQNWLGPVGEKGFFILGFQESLIVRHVTLKNSHNGPNDDSGTDKFSIALSSDGLEWSSVLKGQLMDARGNGSAIIAQDFDIEGVGGSQYLRFSASSWFGERAALNYIGVKGEIESNDEGDTDVNTIETLAETELGQANMIVAQEEQAIDEAKFKELVSALK
jgi:cysteine-rich repeat protein